MNKALRDTEILGRELDDQGALRLTMRDMKRRNALSEAMLGAISTALADAANDPAVRVVVLAAEGPAFSAGHDLKELTAGRETDDGGEDYFDHVMGTCSNMMQDIVRFPKPVIAEVTGVATAAGCQLVASCDLAIAEESARFSTPGVHIGLFCSTPMVALSRNIGNKHAMEMLLTGDMISAPRAAEMGLINYAVPSDELRNRVMEIAHKIASKSANTIRIGKQAFYKQRELPLDEAYAYASRVMVDNMLRADASEGIDAFIEKRKPKWQDE